MTQAKEDAKHGLNAMSANISVQVEVRACNGLKQDQLNRTKHQRK